MRKQSKSSRIFRWDSVLNALGFGRETNRKSRAVPRRRALSIEPLEERALLSVSCYWTGASSSYWNNSGNWENAAHESVLPQAGDDLVFQGTTRTATQNDFTAGTSFHSITFASSGFSVSGNSITMPDGGTISLDSGVTSASISVNIALPGELQVVVSQDGELTLSGVISNSGSNDGGLTKGGTGELILSGVNTYSGDTTINGGTLVVGEEKALGQANAGTFGDLYVNSGATLDLNGHNITTGTLRNSTTAGGRVTDSSAVVGTSYLYLHQPLTVGFAGTFNDTSYRTVAPVRATTVDFYVASSGGSDSASGSQTNPWKTLYHVHNQMWSKDSGIPVGGILPGDHVYFRGGTYDVFDDGTTDKWWCFSRSGVVGYPISFEAYQSETVTWNTTYQLAWTQESQYLWSVELDGTPMQDEWCSYCIHAYVAGSYQATNIYATAKVCITVDNVSTYYYFTQQSGLQTGTATSEELAGTHNGKPFYTDRLDYTVAPRYYLFWNGSCWCISATLNDTGGTAYWSLDNYEGDQSTPPTSATFTAHGTAAGTATVMTVDITSGGALPADFVNPPVETGGLAFYNGSGDLLYDLIYVDPTTHTLYFRSNEVVDSDDVDPNTQVYVGAWSNTLTIQSSASDLVFSGITFNWGTKISNFAPRTTFENCTFLASRIYGTSCDDMEIASCYFDYLGGGESRLDSDIGGGLYQEGWWDQYVYVYGNSMSFHDNFLGRNRSGGAFSLYPGDSDNVQIYNNVVFGSQVAVQNSGDDGRVYNNVLIAVANIVNGTQASPSPYYYYSAWYLIKGNSGQEFCNNYVEVMDGYSIWAVDWTGYTQTDVTIEDNVFVQYRSSGSSQFLISGSMTYSSISDNTWIAEDSLHGGTLDGDGLNTDDLATFVAYLNRVRGTGNTTQLLTEFINLVAVNAYLDGNHTLADVMAYFREYAARCLISVSLDSLTPHSNDTLTATVEKLDICNNSTVELTFVWEVNGVVKRTFTPSAGIVTDTFNLSDLGNGDVNDVVTVEVTATTTETTGEVSGPVVTSEAARVTASTRVWTGAGQDDNWTTADNWSGGVAPIAGDILVFESVTPIETINTFATGTVFSSIEFVDSGFEVTGNSITILDGGTILVDASASSATIEINIAMAGTLSIDVASGCQLTLSGALSGSGALVKAGDGTVTLSGANTYTGGTIVEDGTLVAGNDSALGGTASGLVVDGGTLDLNGHDLTVGAVVLSAGSITGNTGKTLTGASYTVIEGQIAVALSGSGALVKAGDGTVTLSGVNSYTGLTTVYAGTLEFVDGDGSPVLTGGGADIRGGQIVFHYTSGLDNPSATILADLTTSYNAGVSPFAAANGAQMYSSTAAAGYVNALGWSDNGAGIVTVMYTLYGDATLDGSVNYSDMNKVLTNYGLAGTWAMGDFTYNGTVNYSDLNRLLTCYNTTLAPQAPLAVGIYRLGASSTTADSVEYVIVFSEGVSGVDVSDFTLACSGTSGTIASVTPCGEADENGNWTTYVITVSNISGTGTIGLNLIDDDTIEDATLLALVGLTDASGSLVGPTYTIT